MPTPLIEWIPNLSEGRRPAVLDRFSALFADRPGCRLLHRDVGFGANRTVFTVAGEPEAVFAAAYDFFRLATETIDMRTHTGEHPRIGAVDVSPFVAIRGIEEAELIKRVNAFAGRVGEELGVPIYLYERSARREERRNLATIRRGEYEGLAGKLADRDWVPDYGPAAAQPKWGATVLGVRPFLIAWNINLVAGAAVGVAKDLGSRVRAKNGLFPGVKAIGWYIPEFGRCQVSCNIVDPEIVDLGRVYLTTINLARERGAEVTGSELIGLIPEKYLRRVGRAFLFATSGNEEDRRVAEIEMAVDVLGLSDLEPFDWRKRVLEEVLH